MASFCYLMLSLICIQSALASEQDNDTFFTPMFFTGLIFIVFGIVLCIFCFYARSFKEATNAQREWLLFIVILSHLLSSLFLGLVATWKFAWIQLGFAHQSQMTSAFLLRFLFIACICIHSVSALRENEVIFIAATVALPFVLIGFIIIVCRVMRSYDDEDDEEIALNQRSQRSQLTSI
ncbi:hypothetical protein PRIPAC_87175 [Pristionchus pacificus]|uniref:Uncharacterized protein n=1 Tax=Pristionchus pacificus TaxID=54126 RepID=A0A2A6B9F0_PRIPA|nr:hypothetical protein PRIPAC_87175 [Pristionchus pacificus]|eukprot:PDM62494.1 hypothetical protein PRIPAC_51936 [Pristionchus pacificus]